MPVNLEPPGRLDPVAGIRAGVTSLGVRDAPRDDLCVLAIAEGASMLSE